MKTSKETMIKNPKGSPKNAGVFKLKKLGNETF